MGWQTPLIVPGVGAASHYILALAFAGFAVMIAIFALSHHHGSAFSPALVYLSLGLIAAFGVALLNADWLTLDGDTSVVERLSEITVVIALFATGLRIDRPLSLHGWRHPALLLGVTMPLTIAAVAAVAHWGIGLSVGAAIVLGAALAPTDPVLAGDLGVAGPGEGDIGEPNFTLTAEAGMNDGLAFPFVFLGLALAGGDASSGFTEWLLADVVYGVLGGVLVGAVTGAMLARLAHRLRERELVSVELDGWAGLGAALGIYGVAELASTYGFLAAFAGGLAFRRVERGSEYSRGVHAGAETLERVLEVAMILFIGSLVTTAGLQQAGWWSLVLAGALLVVIRPLATLAAFVGSSLHRWERLYVGWFGVRGVGSIYYASAAAGAGVLGTEDAARVLWTVFVVAGVSIILHGTTGASLTRRLGAPGDARPPRVAEPRHLAIEETPVGTPRGADAAGRPTGRS